METLMLALRVVLSLGAVVGVLWYAQRRVSGHQKRTRAGEALTVVARRGVGAKASVVLVDTGGKRFLLGVTEHSVNVLHTDGAPPPDPVQAASAASADAFGEALAQAGASPGAHISGRRRREQQPTPLADPPLEGSILSAETWRNAVAAVRKGPLG
jgi:flagellar protein FliO/FliZ